MQVQCACSPLVQTVGPQKVVTNLLLQSTARKDECKQSQTVNRMTPLVLKHILKEQYIGEI